MDLSIRGESFGVGDQSWLGSEHGTSMTRSITLDTSAFAAATHFPEGFFLSGLPLQQLPSGLYGPYATDGTLIGFLFMAVPAPSQGRDVDVQGAMYEHGRVIVSKLPVELPEAAQEDLHGQIVFM
ncbi:hypothetical protein [Actinoalloteichus sp. GBA129-24]|uniref:hypothetical protein n=1 Tax=Actinoalloteichus sp. GBA129-24 TaxID=1612551 RepID=UPI0009506733|nr:hypothetical protein [Actinoalloteichus sp. GBA129-24]APU20942.1 hypothetical protein UA75_14660 [Actinoalloteichus sp. GBA129-24]APU24191.1 hypothetical protein UA75_31140 [Actinoalloteichus sp. GBA129-24]